MAIVTTLWQRRGMTWMRREGYEAVLALHWLGVLITESWLWLRYVEPWVESLRTDTPHKDQRTKKYIVIGLLIITFIAFVLHVAGTGLFLVMLIAFDVLFVYAIKNRTDLLMRLVKTKADHMKKRNKRRFLRAIHIDNSARDKGKAKAKTKESKKEDSRS